MHIYTRWQDQLLLKQLYKMQNDLQKSNYRSKDSKGNHSPEYQPTSWISFVSPQLQPCTRYSGREMFLQCWYAIAKNRKVSGRWYEYVSMRPLRILSKGCFVPHNASNIGSRMLTSQAAFLTKGLLLKGLNDERKRLLDFLACPKRRR